MNKAGPIIIIDDDLDDQELLRELFNDLMLRNDVRIFAEGEAALQYLNDTEIKPFLIISDIKMPKMDGFELRKLISDKSVHLKATPFLFLPQVAHRRLFYMLIHFPFRAFFKNLCAMVNGSRQ